MFPGLTQGEPDPNEYYYDHEGVGPSYPLGHTFLP